MNAPLANIAIVDDHHMIREVIRSLLVNLGYKVVLEAGNGKRLLEKLQTTRAPDICLLDINMPEMNGFETVKQLKKNYPDIQILVFSMNTESSSVKKMKELGVAGFLPKTSSMEQIHAALSGIVNRSRKALGAVTIS
jgi:DNA-binding NarL/FixJ family response regulator